METELRVRALDNSLENLPFNVDIDFLFELFLHLLQLKKAVPILLVEMSLTSIILLHALQYRVTLSHVCI